MAHYAIGDVQGCLSSLKVLLNRIHFCDQTDTLWFAGDLVNRGPESLDTLRFIRNLGPQAKVVLGNHDLHLLALWCGFGKPHHEDTLSPILQAPDGPDLIDWLRKQPLIHALPNVLPNQQPALMVHAGILPSWSFEQAIELSNEVQTQLSSPNWTGFMAELYGNKPKRWSEELTGYDRLRLIVNVCTRLRMLTTDEKLDFKFKDHPSQAPDDLHPWFNLPSKRSNGLIVFGHWSTLNQIQNAAGYCLDTGCVWGGELTALRLNDLQCVAVQAVHAALPI